MAYRPFTYHTYPTLRIALLWALTDSAGSGLELSRRIRQRTEYRMPVGINIIYPTLWNLEDEGLVTSWETDPVPERGYRPLKYYRITSAGLQEVHENKASVAGLFPD